VSRFIDCYAECRYAECRYAECRYAECHFAKCRGAIGVEDFRFGKKNKLFSAKEIEKSASGAKFTKLYFLLQLSNGPIS
jgi:hypothetical protein